MCYFRYLFSDYLLQYLQFLQWERLYTCLICRMNIILYFCLLLRLLVVPVSYTHLDVYKRQVWISYLWSHRKCIFFFTIGKFLCCRNDFLISIQVIDSILYNTFIKVINKNVCLTWWFFSFLECEALLNLVFPASRILLEFLK